MRQKSVTILDIARRVGVSKTTISRYLNGQYEFMSGETRNAVARAIEELNYRPSYVARSLKSKQSKLAGIVIHSLENHVIVLFLRGLCDVLYEHGYSPIILNSYNGEALEIQNLLTCLDQQVDGIILSPSSSNFSFYSDICKRGTPVVMANRYAADWQFDAAYTDHYAMVQQAMNHLWGNGYARIAFITDNLAPISTKAWREQSFADFMTRVRPGEEHDIFYLPPGSQQDLSVKACQAVATFLQRHPLERKALVCANAAVLCAVLAAVQKLGISIPAHLGLCGYDAFDWGALIRPGITSLNQPFLELGRAAALLLMERLSGKLPPEPQIRKLQGELAIRESTGSWQSV